MTLPAPLKRCLVAVIAGLSCTFAHAQSENESLLKAAFTYNFVKFIDWPGEAESSAFELCLLSEDAALISAFEVLNGKNAQGKPLHVRIETKSKDKQPCQLIYISEPENPRLAERLQQLQSAHTLTVSDAEQFAQSGGMIGLVNVNDKLQIELNLERVQRAGLKVNAQLARLARIVKDSPTR